MKITFNSINAVTGVITNDEPLRQGNVGANTLTAVFEGKSNLAYTATFNYTRSDDGRLKDIPMTPTANVGEYYYKFSNPWFFAVYGETTLTVYLKNASNEIVASGQITFPIEQTDFDDDPNITYSEYQALLDSLTIMQIEYEPHNVRGYDTLVSAESDLSQLAFGQLIIVKTDPVKIYQVQENEEFELYLAPLDSVGDYLPLSGGTMSGAISQPVAPVADDDLANKKYVDDSVKVATDDIADIIDGDLTVHTAYHAEMDVSGRNLVDLAKTSDLELKQSISEKGQADGYASLDSGGRVPSSQLPAYVDDILEFADLASFPATGTSGIIYVALDTNLTYRWSGSGYTEISPSLALGETSATAYRGDKGKTAYDHSQLVSGNPHNVIASETGFDNTIKNLLTATNLQEAVDELSEKKEDIIYGTETFETANYTGERTALPNCVGMAVPFKKTMLNGFDITKIKTNITTGNLALPVELTIFVLNSESLSPSSTITILKTIDVTLLANGEVEFDVDIKNSELSDNFLIGIRTKLPNPGETAYLNINVGAINSSWNTALGEMSPMYSNRATTISWLYAYKSYKDQTMLLTLSKRKELVYTEDLSEYAKSVDVLTKNEQGYEKPVSVNIYNKETSVESSWFSSSNGQIETYPTNPYIQQFGRTDYIEVEGSTDYYLSIDTLNYIDVYIAYFDANKTFIRNETLYASSAINYTGSSFNTPANCKYIGISFNSGKGKWIKESHLQIEEGLTPTPYQEYVGDKIYLNKLLIKENQIEKSTISSIIDLPKKYDVVVDDTFELFYNSLLKVRNYKNYYTICICDIGTCLSRKFILRTVTSDMIGEHTLTFILYDNLGELVEQKSVVLNVVAKATSPVNEKVVLCIGDSLTQNGYWVEELNRRLTKNTSVARNGDAAPTGLGLTNIKFIGKCILGETRFEGYGGWDYDNYLSTTVPTMYYVSVASHDKTSADQESIWKDSNNVEWQLETIETNRLKFKKYSGTGVMPLSGTLTWVSGGTHTTSIVFTSSSIAEGNPFNYNGVINFASYCVDMGVSTIDDVYILLGWNGASFSDDAYKTKIETFVDKLIEFNSNIKITLIGLETPSYDGIGNNYGARSLSFISNKNYVYRRNALYESIAKQSKYSGIMTFVQLSGQFDSEYNMPFENRDVNVRNNEKIVEQTNGVHPAVKGYYQIADAVYRCFNDNNS